MNLRGKRILVTGGDGFLGGHLVPRLEAASGLPVAVPRFPEYDLTDREHARRMYREFRPAGVMPLAAMVGGDRGQPKEDSHSPNQTDLHVQSVMVLNSALFQGAPSPRKGKRMMVSDLHIAARERTLRVRNQGGRNRSMLHCPVAGTSLATKEETA